jgi:hypothetical protein
MGVDKRFDIGCGVMVPCSGPRSLVDGVDSSAMTGYQYSVCAMAAPSIPFAGVEKEKAVAESCTAEQVHISWYASVVLSLLPALFDLSALAEFTFFLLSIARCTFILNSCCRRYQHGPFVPQVTCFHQPLQGHVMMFDPTSPRPSKLLPWCLNIFPLAEVPRPYRNWATHHYESCYL